MPTCICPECKNAVDLARYQNLAAGNIIECNRCGVALEVKGINDGVVATEIVDEGK